MSFTAQELECSDEWNETVETEDLLEKRLFHNGALFFLSNTSTQKFPRCGNFFCRQKILISFGSKKTMNESCVFNLTVECSSERSTATSITDFTEERGPSVCIILIFSHRGVYSVSLQFCKNLSQSLFVKYIFSDFKIFNRITNHCFS